MSEIAAYLDRWTAAPGSEVTVHLSGDTPGRACVDLLRLGCGSERCEPDGIPGDPVPQVLAQEIPVETQPVMAGSWAHIAGLGRLQLSSACLAVLVQPWRIDHHGQTVLAIASADCHLRITLDSLRGLGLRCGDAFAATDFKPALRRWHLLTLEWSADALVLQVQRLEGGPIGQARLSADFKTLPEHLVLAGRANPTLPASPHRGDFDGRLERPVLWRVKPDQQALKAALLSTRDLPVDALACWDFARGIDRWQIEDIGPAALHGQLHQGPKRAVRGARWSGVALRWHEAPHEYGAIHFHTDDLLDACWSPSVSLQLPTDLRSGVYAVRVRLLNATGPSLSGELRLPLFVPPAPNAQRARVALVFPTFTYHAYANDRCALLGNNPEVLAARAITLEPRDVLLSRHPEWGLSLYDTHLDGSGVSLTSRLRPVPGHHPDQRAWQAGEGSGRWNFAGDLLLVQWLEREGIAWDALTDDLLHEHGRAALAPYAVALTGNHPEYASPQLLNAWREWVAAGGRMMYLGGNGFYWKVAIDKKHPGLMELRRAEDGNRSWAEEPGEYWHALDGAYGGLWRRNGIAPQSWLGVGYCGQGFRRSTGYRRNPDSHLLQTAFVFAGVSEETFGLTGAIGGGCAGIEVDRHDPLLGSDPDSYVLASSLPFDASYLLANEEILVSRPTITADFALNVRADVVLQIGPGTGAVFSTGSIAWIGGLSELNGDTAVQQITRNVISRFMDATPLQSGRQHLTPNGPQT